MSNLQRMLKMASQALDKKGQTSSSGSGKTDWREMVRTAADKVTGADRAADRGPSAPQRPDVSSEVSTEDRAAIARYNYLLETAPPEQLESVHREAFARLSPAQREQVEAQLRAHLPANEQPASASSEDLARSATRGEAHNPGFLRGLFAKPSGRGAAGALAGVGLGAAGGLLAAVAGGAVLSSVAAPLLEQAAGMGVDFESFAGGFDGIAEGAGDYAAGLSEQASELGSNFEIPGLSGLSNFFGRDS
ncbi:hypothetical protein [Conyzicola sp.]|uniref:hypothetical protein n=1 Tax=Conyzicola sp. TaxID=1969404 RepID=UPI003989D710